MNIAIKRKRSTLAYKIFSAFMAFTFIFSSIIPPRQAYSQTVPASPAGGLNLPIPGTMVPLSPVFAPALIKGLKIFPDNPLRFDFIVDPGDSGLNGENLKVESSKLIKYFLASITVPEEDMWVNLSPYERDRIIPDDFGKTEMGRDLLAQDYMLKQITASLMYPEEAIGKEFWDRVYKKAHDVYGTSEVPVNTFNKVWIVPEKALVYENGDTVFVTESHLKVLLDSDYKAMKEGAGDRVQGIDVSEQIIRAIIIPELEKEVNTGKNFANLRQIYNSVILAAWFRRNLKESFLGKTYMDQNKVNGVNAADETVNRKIYHQYLEAFKFGVYDFIKEDYDPKTQAMIPRKYFSGGALLKLGEAFGKSTTPTKVELSAGSIVVSSVLESVVPVSLAASSPVGQGDLIMKQFEELRKMGLSDEEIKFRQKVQERMRKLIPDSFAVALDASNDGEKARDVLTGLSQPLWDGGPSAVNASFPVEFGGFELGPMSEAILTTEIAIASQSVALVHDVWMGLTASILEEYGTDAQKEQFLRPLLNADILMSYSLTEPGSGSDAASMSMTAKRDEDHYILNGEKMFITVGAIADYSIVFAITDPEAHKEKASRGISAFIVPMDHAGVEVHALKSMAGQRGSATAAISFDNARIPKENILGPENQGFPIAMEALDSGRIAVSTIILSALEISLEEVSKKYQVLQEKGAPRQRLEELRHAMFEMMADAYAARQLLNDAVNAKKEGKPFSLQAATVKLKSAEDAVKNVARAIELVGPEALKKGHPLERVFRDTKILAILEGTTQIMRIVIAANLIKMYEIKEDVENPDFDEVMIEQFQRMPEELRVPLVYLTEFYREQKDEYFKGRIKRRMIDLYAEGQSVKLMEEAKVDNDQGLVSWLYEFSLHRALTKAASFVKEAEGFNYLTVRDADPIPEAWKNEMGTEIERFIFAQMSSIFRGDKKDESNELLNDQERISRAVKRRQDALKEFFANGYIGTTLNEDFAGSGLDEISFRDQILRTVSDPALALMILEHEKGMAALNEFGLGDQLEQYLTGGKIITEALLDPEDALIETIVVFDDGRVQITGEKTFVINGAMADTLIVFAKDEKGFSAFLVEREQEGVDVSPLDVLGLSEAGMSEVTFDNANAVLLGERGKGLEALKVMKDQETTAMAAISKGIGSYLVKKGTRYASEIRKAFGQHIINFPDVRELIEESEDDIGKMDHPNEDPPKLLQRISERILQAHGGIGYSKEETIAKIWFTAEVMRTLQAARQYASIERALTASSPVDDTVGGIDFNPNDIKLQIEGKGIDFNLPVDPREFESMPANGFTPVIFQMTPVTNIPFLLGETQELEEQQLSGVSN